MKYLAESLLYIPHLNTLHLNLFSNSLGNNIENLKHLGNGLISLKNNLRRLFLNLGENNLNRNI